jgi:hypothetical protein
MPLGSDHPVSLRIPEAVLEQADALIPVVAANEEYRAVLGGVPTRAAVLRLAIVKGLAVIRAEQSTRPPGER